MNRPLRYDAPPLRLAAAVLAALLLALSLGACSAVDDLTGREDDGGDKASDEADREDAMLDYARCMREHGVPMEDPSSDRGLIIQGDGSIDQDTIRAAEEECGEIIEDVLPREGAGEMPEEQKEAMLAMARCMRERGWDMPDPQFEGGRVTQRMEGGIDPEDPSFRKDSEECAQESGVNMPRMQGGS